MIDLKDVSYSYGRREALTDVTCSLPTGIHLLVGENGAGKTTLLHIIAGLLRPATGCCEIDGNDVWPRKPMTQSATFFMADNMELPFRDLTTAARVHAPFYPNFSADDLATNLTEFGISAETPLRRMSLGERRRAVIAYVLALHPEVLLLDEPANGLDIDARKTLRRMMGRCVGDSQTVVVSTHVVADLEPLFDNLIVLSHGRSLLCSPLWQIAGRLGFARSASPVADAVYQEPDEPFFRAIVETGDESESAVDIALLYSAIMSESRDKILSAL